MKSVNQIFAFMVVCGVAVSSSLASVGEVATSNLRVYTLENTTSTRNPDSAILVMDEKAQTLTLSLYQDPCGQLQPNPNNEIRCKAAAFFITEFTLPYSKSELDACGTVKYAGKLSNLTQGGEDLSIEVVDNGFFSCFNPRLVNPVYGEAEVLTGAGRMHLRFSGSAFVR